MHVKRSNRREFLKSGAVALLGLGLGVQAQESQKKPSLEGKIFYCPGSEDGINIYQVVPNTSAINIFWHLPRFGDLGEVINGWIREDKLMSSIDGKLLVLFGTFWKKDSDHGSLTYLIDAVSGKTLERIPYRCTGLSPNGDELVGLSDGHESKLFTVGIDGQNYVELRTIMQDNQFQYN